MKALLRIYKEARKYWGYIVFSTISLFLITGANLISPGIMQKLVSILESGIKGNTAVKQVAILAILLTAIYLFQSVFRYFNNYYIHLAAWRFVSAIRVKVYNHFQKLSLSFYQHKQTHRPFKSSTILIPQTKELNCIKKAEVHTFAWTSAF